jgi:hypothetical protein
VSPQSRSPLYSCQPSGCAPTERGARNMAAQAGLIAGSTHSSNVKPRFRETAGFAIATFGRGIAPDDEVGVEPASKGGAAASKFNLDQSRVRQTGYSLNMNDNPTPPACPGCGKSMPLIHSIPRLGSLPELLVFYCAKCQHAETLSQADDSRKKVATATFDTARAA